MTLHSDRHDNLVMTELWTCIGAGKQFAMLSGKLYMHVCEPESGDALQVRTMDTCTLCTLQQPRCKLSTVLILCTQLEVIVFLTAHTYSSKFHSAWCTALKGSQYILCVFLQPTIALHLTIMAVALFWCPFRSFQLKKHNDNEGRAPAPQSGPVKAGCHAPGTHCLAAPAAQTQQTCKKCTL